jgi:nucleoside 2-deoxyribosyltransferase
MREPAVCPLCQRDGAVITERAAFNRDAIKYSCPRCGTFVIDTLLSVSIAHDIGEQLFRVSHITRKASDAGEPLFLDTVEMAQSLASSVPQWRRVDDGVGRFLIALARKTGRYTAQLSISPENDYPLVPTRDASEYTDLWTLASQMGYIDAEFRRITPDGWRKIESLRETAGLTRQAFVAMWFAPTMEDAWNEGFKPGVESSNYFSALRIDRKEFNNKIDDEIIAEIRRSGLLVADFTGHRGGVYFEAGFGMGLGVPVIWTCKKSDMKRAHFDTRQYNHIVWETPADLASRLDARIRASVLPLIQAAS